LGGVAAFKNKKTWERSRALRPGKVLKIQKPNQKGGRKVGTKENDQVLIMI